MFIRSTVHPFLRVGLAALLFGAATPASKVLLRHLHPIEMAGMLYFGAALSALPGILKRRSLYAPVDRGDRNRLLVAIVAGGIVAPIFLLYGLRLGTAASVSLWLNLEIVATAVLGVIFFRDYLGRKGWAAVGGVLIAGSILGFGESLTGMAAGFLVAVACFFWGLDNQLAASIASISPTQMTFWKGAVAGTFNIVVAVVLGNFVPHWPSIGLAILVGAVCYGASIMLYIGAARELGASRAGLVFAGTPFLGLLLSVTVLQEPLAIRHVVALILFAASIYVLLRSRHTHLHRHERVQHAHAHRHDDGHHGHRHPELEPSHRHVHWHEHEPVIHTHPHWPDLHHRHRHHGLEEVSEAGTMRLDSGVSDSESGTSGKPDPTRGS